MEKNTVVIEKCIENIGKVIDVSGDVIVPDIKPDIINIINTNGIAYIYKEDVQNKKVRLDGNIDIYVVYLSDTGDTRSIQTVLSFSEYIENEGITDKTFFKTNVIVDKIEAKVLNERKISIKATLKLECELYEEDTIELTTDYKDDDTVEVLKENIKAIEKALKVKENEQAVSSFDYDNVNIEEVNSTNLLFVELSLEDASQVKQIADNLQNKYPNCLIFVMSATESKVVFVAKANSEINKKGIMCGKLVKEAAMLCGGNGGGRPDFAQAGGKDSSKAKDVYLLIKGLL